MKYRPELDGLRGVAVLTVLAAHAGFPGFAPEGGLAGVTLFFVLSGYLISSLLLAERDATQRIDLRAFYLRRALRLFPALGAVLAVVAVGSLLGLWPKAGGDMLIAIPAVVFYVGNWFGGSLGVLGHTWSLAVEEQFYLVWPVALILALRMADRRTIAIAAVFGSILVTPWRAQLLLNGDLGHAFSGTDAHADALLLGCVIALMEIRLPSIAGWIGLMGVVLTGALWIGGGGLVIMVPLATVFAVLAVAGCPLPIRWGPLAYVGRISYGLYLWHFLFIWWGLPWPVVIVLSFSVASLSYRVIELPFLRLKDRLRARAGTEPGLTQEPNRL